MNHVAFTQMKDGTAEEYQFLQTLEHNYIRSLPDRLLTALEGLGESLAGYQISRLEHSLQTATRAEADGADIDMVVAALVHDHWRRASAREPLANGRRHTATLCTRRGDLGD